MTNQDRFYFNFTGPGWYGPLGRHDSQGNYTEYVRVPTDAGKDDPFTASNDAYGHCGTPDWFDSLPEWATA